MTRHVYGLTTYMFLPYHLCTKCYISNNYLYMYRAIPYRWLLQFNYSTIIPPFQLVVEGKEYLIYRSRSSRSILGMRAFKRLNQRIVKLWNELPANTDFSSIESFKRTLDGFNFYPNVTMLRSGLCYRNSVCRLSSVCLSVTLVHPT